MSDKMLHGLAGVTPMPVKGRGKSVRTWSDVDGGDGRRLFVGGGGNCTSVRGGNLAKRKEGSDTVSVHGV